MTVGVPVNREWIVVLCDGTPVIDWGDGLAVDLFEGEFVPYDKVMFSHAIQDNELEYLKKVGRLVSYDKRHVFVYSLPETPNSQNE